MSEIPSTSVHRSGFPRRSMDEVMLTKLKRHEIQVLRRAGHTQAEIAELTGVSVRSIRRIESEDAVCDLDDHVAVADRSVGRPSVTDAFRAFVSELLEQEPDLRSLEVLRRARLRGYSGGKSAMYGLIAELRPRTKRLEARFDGLPGEFSQHDFGQVDVRFGDGTERRIHFFASRLKYSRTVAVTIVDDQRVESLVRVLCEHFERFGGVPLLAVFDRPKTVALKWNRAGEVTEFNPTFASAALEMGIGVEVCWPYRANQKGAVENLVGWVKGSFFKVRVFHDFDDLVEQLSEWEREVNEERPSRATGEVPAIRLAQERERMRPVKVTSEDFALRIPLQVGPTGVVTYETHRYSMPPEAAGLPATLYLHRDRVRIVAGRHEAEHPRGRDRESISTLPEHRAERLAVMSGKRGKRYLMRQHLLELGEVAETFLTELVHRRPRQWYGDVERLHGFLQEHGENAVRLALRTAVTDGRCDAEYVGRLLGKQGPQLGLLDPEAAE